MIKEGKLDRSALDKIIGKYGIGFLASFIIADKVEVLSRSRADEAAGGIRALFTGETNWYWAKDSTAAPGTEFRLKLKRSVTDPTTGSQSAISDLLNVERLKKEVRRFGDLLPYPIFVHHAPMDVDGDLANVMKGPWEVDQFNVRTFIDYLKARHLDENEPLTAAAFSFQRETHKVAAHGLIYFPRKGAESGESVAKVELTCQRFFITDNITSLLPDWATFVRVLVECPDLSPTLDRNDVIRYDPAFVALKQALGQRIIEILKHIAQSQTEIFSELRSDHRDRIYKALRSDFEQSERGKAIFFRSLVEYIPFTVIRLSAPEGESMTLRKYRDEITKRQPRQKASQPSVDKIYYLHDPASMGQYKAMIIQRDLPVILAKRTAEVGVLQAYGSVFHDEVVVEDVKEILGELYVDPVDQSAYEAIKQFLANLDGGGPDEVTASRFAPSYVPAIVVRSAADPRQTQFLERLLAEGGSVLGPRVRKAMESQLRAALIGQSTLTVVLNDNNPLVRSIRDHCAGKALGGLVADVLHEVYHNARIYADPVAAEDQHFFEFRNALLGKLLEIDQNLLAVQNERDELKILVKDLGAPSPMESHDCALLLTDLRGSTRMVSFTDRKEGADILQQYAQGIGDIVRRYEGKVGGFTGDGVFAQFGLEAGRLDTAAQKANECAFEIHGFTTKFFAQGAVANTLLASGELTIKGSRTVLHWARVMHGRIASAPAVVGPQVVALFRACDRDDLFDRHAIILTGSFMHQLHLPKPLAPIARDFKVDPNLPPMSFYPHPALAQAMAESA